MSVTTRHWRQAGDTIVEVLIATAVISLILATAYATSNRSVANIQDVQEHSEALKLVEAQVEYLRSNDGIGSSDTCFNPSTGAPTSAVADCSVGAPPYTLAIAQPDGATPYVVTAHWTTIHDTQSTVTVYYRP